VVLALIATVTTVNPARAEVRILGVDPERSGSALTCVVRTRGLPDPPALETLSSGLPSSLSLALALVEPSGRERGGTRIEIRIEPDPWERSFRIRWPGAEHHAADLAEVARRLERLGPFTVAILERSGGPRSLRVRARILTHALAPAETEQAHALFAGDMGAGGAERRETSVGLSSLLRFFLGRGPAGRWDATATSAPFEAGPAPVDPAR